MKTTFTLFLLSLVLTFSTDLNAQLNEGFETAGGIDYYQTKGWNFYGAEVDYNSQVTERGSIYIIPSTSNINNTNANSNTSQIVSPFVNFANGGFITFTYKITNNLVSTSTRTFTLRLMDASGTITSLYSFVIANATLPGVPLASPVIPVPINTGNRRVIIDFTGHGTGNSAMYFDNLSLQPNEINNIVPLPIKLLSFTGNLNNKKASLSWNVDANETGEYFEVQKSNDGKSFSTAALLFITEKSGLESYQFSEALQTATYYRLRMVNKDHSIAYSKVIYLKESAANSGEETIRMLQNPIQESLRFSFNASLKEQTIVTLYNIAGVAAFSTTLTSQAGTNAMNLNLDKEIQKGTYILEVRSASERRTIKVHK